MNTKTEKKIERLLNCFTTKYLDIISNARVCTVSRVRYHIVVESRKGRGLEFRLFDVEAYGADLKDLSGIILGKWNTSVHVALEALTTFGHITEAEQDAYSDLIRSDELGRRNNALFDDVRSKADRLGYALIKKVKDR